MRDNDKKCHKKILTKPHQKLNTKDINRVMDCYAHIYKDFLFVGALPIDGYKEKVAKLYMKKVQFEKIYKKGIRRIAVVFNTDPSYKRGEHWIAVFFIMKPKILEIEYFDSLGAPPLKNVLKYINKYIKRAYDFDHSRVVMKMNVIEYQPINDEWNCGVYVLYFIILRLKGISFENVKKYLTIENIEKYRSLLTRKTHDL